MTTYSSNRTQLGQLIAHKDLLISWTGRIVKARYQQSVLGGLWAVVQPLALALIFTAVFTFVVRMDTGEIPYIIFSYSALVPWLLFEQSISSSVQSLVVNMGLVSKIYFPREILPMAEVAARLVDFLIAFVVLIGFMLYYGRPIFTLNWIFLPVILIVQLSLVLGIGLIGSALNVFFRDVSHVVILILKVWMYATPIIYPVSLVEAQLASRGAENLLSLYFINPMAAIIESYRNVLLYDSGLNEYFGLAAIISFVVLAFGYWLFKRLEFNFADIV
ncbi:MAG: ABC transporter permease [Chloroflexota bacterium]